MIVMPVPGNTALFITSKDLSPEALCGNPHIGIGQRDDLGLCVLARFTVSKGDVLDSFSGELGPEMDLHSLQVRPGQHISGTRFIGFLSHGCDPNCRLDMDRFELVALRDIAAGELLTIDYAATEDVLYRQFECHCGALMCRGWITGRAEQISADGKRVLATHNSSKQR